MTAESTDYAAGQSGAKHAAASGAGRTRQGGRST